MTMNASFLIKFNNVISKQFFGKNICLDWEKKIIIYFFFKIYGELNWAIKSTKTWDWIWIWPENAKMYLEYVKQLGMVIVNTELLC